jgi:hypothetical protein
VGASLIKTELNDGGVTVVDNFDNSGRGDLLKLEDRIIGITTTELFQKRFSSNNAEILFGLNDISTFDATFGPVFFDNDIFFSTQQRGPNSGGIIGKYNFNPEVSEVLPNVVINENFGDTTINLSGVFFDVDGDTISLSVAVDDANVISSSLSTENLSITEFGTGSTEIRITATDVDGASVQTSFIFRVNAIPFINGELPPIIENEGFQTTSLDLLSFISDSDEEDTLEFEAVNTTDSIVNVSVNDSNLIIEEKGIGTTKVVLTASDGVGGSVTDTLVFRVNSVPETVGSIENQLIQGDATELVISINSIFIDDDGDSLEVDASSSDEGVAMIDQVREDSLIIAIVGTGTSTIIIEASDGVGGFANTSFDLKVNASPASFEIQEILLSAGFGQVSIDLDSTFEDEDGDVLSYEVTEVNDQVIETSISGSILTIIEKGIGSVTIIIEANDGFGGIGTNQIPLRVEELTNLNEDTLKDFFTIFPNPAKDFIFLKPSKTISESLLVVIFDASGQIVTEQIKIQGIETMHELDITNLREGIYLFKMQKGPKSIIYRFVKEK